MQIEGKRLNLVVLQGAEAVAVHSSLQSWIMRLVLLWLSLLSERREIKHELASLALFKKLHIKA